MLILTGRNLGERHRELNLKVTEAAVQKINMEEIKSKEEHSDVDRLFKIDLASRYKNINYILEVLACGDSVYITRALKSTWIYDDEFSTVINTGFLHHQLFPHMSIKMKKKMLTAISTHVRNEDRVICFYSYCINTKLLDLAFKFLICTPKSFKTDLITTTEEYYLIDCKSKKSSLFLKQFIGNSLELALNYVEMQSDENRKKDIIYELRFLYSISAEEYLDAIEDYEDNNPDVPNGSSRFGIRISKDVLKHHKTRVFKYPVLYLNKLNKNVISRYLTIEEVKTLSCLVLPSSSSQFWSIDVYNTYKFILNKIPANELYLFIKKIFGSKYKGEPFEMDKRFYDLQYYKLLSIEEREEWALRHIEHQEELFGSGNDYIWYKFVSFDKALLEIKKYVFITPNDDKRSEIVNILVESAHSLSELTKLFNYYYYRHANESEEHKESFINKVIAEHDIYTFDDVCWTQFDDLLCSLNVYTIGFRGRDQYKMRSMIYHILYNKVLPSGLQAYLEGLSEFYNFENVVQDLSEERQFTVIKYWLNFHAGKVEILLEKLPNDKVKEDILDHISCVWQIIFFFRRNYDECPEIIITYMKSDMDKWQYHPRFREPFVKRTQGDFIRWLKTDMQLAIDGINEIRCNAYRWSFRLTSLFRKLRIYFSSDVTKVYLEYFNEFLSKMPPSYREYRNIKTAIVGTLILADEKNKVSLIEKYVPTCGKIAYRNIDNRLLQVQKAICRLAYYSRPPLPIANVLKYMDGDYVRYCLPLFNTYLANFPVPLSVEFTKQLLNSPLSKQKHGLRLAFQCFRAEDLVKLIYGVWEKTKNVSLRTLLYKQLFNKIVKDDKEEQNVLYELLKLFTSDLNHQDQEDIFDLLVSEDMPEGLRGNYIETAWMAVSKLSNKNINLKRKSSVIYHMEDNLDLVQRNFVWQHVIQEHIRTVLYKNKLKSVYTSSKIGELIEAKWDVTAKYIISFNTPEELEQSLDLTRNIISNCLQTWSHEYKKVYTSREFCFGFLSTIEDQCPEDINRCINLVPIYQCVLDLMENSLLKEEMYLTMWPLKLSIAIRKIIHQHFKSIDCVCDNGEPKFACVKRISVLFANVVGDIVKQMVATKEFYCSFYTAIARALANISKKAGYILKTRSAGFKLLVSGRLAEFKTTETHILALMIMPTDPPEKWEITYRNSIEKIKQYNNAEVRSYMYAKFVNTDFNVRKYIF